MGGLVENGSKMVGGRKSSFSALPTGLKAKLAAGGGSAAFGCISLLLIQMKVLWGAWTSWDLPPFDGAGYFATARDVALHFHFPSMADSPLFAGFYSLLYLGIGSQNPYLITVAHRIVVILLITVLVYVIARSLFTPLIAWLAALLMIFNRTILVEDNYVVHIFVLIPVCLAIWAALSQSSMRKGLVLGALIFASVSRPEFVATLVMMTVLIIASDWVAIRKTGLTREFFRAYIPVLPALVVVGVMVLNGAPLNSSRSWIAFGQHYAWGYQERHPEWDVNFWEHWQDITTQDFGSATTISQAAVNNPNAFAGHVIWNIDLLPINVLKGVVSVGYNTPFGLIAIAASGVLSIVGALTFVLPGWSVGILPLRWGHSLFWWLLIAIWVPQLASAVLIRPYDIYLVSGVIPLMLILAGCGLTSVFSRFHMAQANWLLPAIFAAVLIVSPMPFIQPQPRPVLSAVESLKRMPGSQDYGLLAESAFAYCLYTSNPQCKSVEVEQVMTDTAFKDGLSTYPIRVIIVDDTMKATLSPGGNQFIRTLETNPGTVGWEVYDASVPYKIYRRIEP